MLLFDFKNLKFIFFCLFTQVYKSDVTGDKSPNLLEVDGSKKSSRADALSTCDSGSEVSDEGYKSSSNPNSSLTGANVCEMSNSQEKKMIEEDELGNDSINGKTS